MFVTNADSDKGKMNKWVPCLACDLAQSPHDQQPNTPSKSTDQDRNFTPPRTVIAPLPDRNCS
jgi:hypothetical protein